MNIRNRYCHSRVSALVCHGLVILEQALCVETVIFLHYFEGVGIKGVQLKVKLLHSII